jgi:poly-gamma-glutamate synthesis protein (capsule biosynthesis protein)
MGMKSKILFGALVLSIAVAPSQAHQSSSRDPSRSFRLIALGQALIKYDLRQYARAEFDQAVEYLRGPDVCFSNLEVAIDVPASGEPTKERVQIGKPEVLDCLKEMGINMLALGNNHSWDLGTEGVLATIEEVKKRGFGFAGTGGTESQATAPGYLETPAGRVALVAMATGSIAPEARATEDRPGVNELRFKQKNLLKPEDTKRILDSIREAAARADYVIAYQHNHEWANEGAETPGWQKYWARRCIDAGATVFIGHGARVLHGVEIYQGQPIFYNLGSFIFHSRQPAGHHPPPVWQTLVADCTFEQGKVTSIKFTPIVLNDKGKSEELFFQTRGAPRPAKGQVAKEILERFAEMSKKLDTEIVIQGDTALLVIPDDADRSVIAK